MFTVEEVSFNKSASVINAESRREVEDIMDRIYREDRSNWPYGVSIRGHVETGGNVYMIRSASTREPVGFTGWQEFQEKTASGKPIKVGYYSIGILPEFRNNGFAKAAVSQLLKVKAASVDQVKAFIVPHNAPSHRLAESLGVPVVHDV